MIFAIPAIIAFSLLLWLVQVVRGWSDHSDPALWVRNPSDHVVVISIDGGAPNQIRARDAEWMRLDPGVHRISITDGATREDSFDLPGREHPWSWAPSALYDTSGGGEYAVVHVTWGRNEQPIIEPIGEGRAFFVFPDHVTRLVTYFAERNRRNAEEVGVCAVVDDRLPCLD